jgi:hypothetical protein
VGFGSEMLFLSLLGLVVLGPKGLHSMLRRVARAKAQFDKAKRGIQSPLAAEFGDVRSENNLVTGLDIPKELRKLL